MLKPNKNFFFSCSYCSCITFILTSYPLYTQGIPNFDVNWYSIFTENYFSFEKGSNGQSHYHKKISPIKISSPYQPLPLNTIWRTLRYEFPLTWVQKTKINWSGSCPEVFYGIGFLKNLKIFPKFSRKTSELFQKDSFSYPLSGCSCI